MPRYFISKEDCPSCEDAHSYLVDSEKEVHHIQSAANELNCIGDVGRVLASFIIMRTEQDKEIDFPIVILTGQEAITGCRCIFSDSEEDEAACKDGRCSLKKKIVWGFDDKEEE